MALAKRIQSRFLPEHPPRLEGYLFATDYTAALGVGGDYYDFIRLDEAHWLIAIGDVSGKGVSAALYMAKLTSEMRMHAAGKSDPADILRRVNKSMLREMADGMFVTMLLAVLNVVRREIQIANAGHLVPLLRRSDGEVLQMQLPTNEPVGMPNYGGFEQERFKLEPGDVVLFFTDGVSEAMNNSRELFGDARVTEAIGSAEDATPEGIRSALLRAIDQFCGDAPQNDDLTLIAFGPVPQ